MYFNSLNHKPIDSRFTNTQPYSLEEKVSLLTRYLEVRYSQIQHYIKKELKGRNQSYQKYIDLESKFQRLSYEHQKTLQNISMLEAYNDELRQKISMLKGEIKNLRDRPLIQDIKANDKPTISPKTPDQQQLTLKIQEYEQQIVCLRNDMKEILLRKVEKDVFAQRSVKFVYAVHKALANLDMIEVEEPLDIKKNWKILKCLMRTFITKPYNDFWMRENSLNASRSAGKLTRIIL